jgi:hypothetical protein
MTKPGPLAARPWTVADDERLTSLALKGASARWIGAQMSTTTVAFALAPAGSTFSCDSHDRRNRCIEMKSKFRGQNAKYTDAHKEFADRRDAGAHGSYVDRFDAS